MVRASAPNAGAEKGNGLRPPRAIRRSIPIANLAEGEAKNSCACASTKKQPATESSLAWNGHQSVDRICIGCVFVDQHHFRVDQWVRERRS